MSHFCLFSFSIGYSFWCKEIKILRFPQKWYQIIHFWVLACVILVRNIIWLVSSSLCFIRQSPSSYSKNRILPPYVCLILCYVIHWMNEWIDEWMNGWRQWYHWLCCHLLTHHDRYLSMLTLNCGKEISMASRNDTEKNMDGSPNPYSPKVYQPQSRNSPSQRYWQREKNISLPNTC